MTFWLGRPGTVLTALPHPGRGIQATLERPSRTRQTIGGGQTSALSPAPGRRGYDLQWSSLTFENRSTIEEFHSGAKGTGPWILLDPWRRNHLQGNQSAATSLFNDTTGFTPSSSETVTSSAALVYRGPKALQWAATSATSGILTFDPPNGLTGWPTPATTAWTLQARVRGGGSDPIVTIGCAIVWLDSAGATLSTSTGSTVATASGSWSQISVSATAPANAVWFKPQLRITPASISSSTLVTVDVPMLDMNSTVRTWVHGTGMPLVTLTGSDTSYRRPQRATATLTLVEVGT